METLERRKKISDMMVSWLSLIGVAAAVIFGFIKYNTSLTELSVDRFKTTLGYVERYGGDQMLKFRSQVSDFEFQMRLGIQEKFPELIKSQYMQDYETTNEQGSFLLEHSADVLNSMDVGVAMYYVVRFFDELWICVDSGFCDQKTAMSFFQQEARSHRLYLWAIISSSRRESPRYGVGIEKFSSAQLQNVD